MRNDNNIICDSSGFKIKASQAARQWNGMIVRKDLIDPYPKRFLHPDATEQLIPGVVNPEGTDVFIDLPTEEDVGS